MRDLSGEGLVVGRSCHSVATARGPASDPDLPFEHFQTGRWADRANVASGPLNFLRTMREFKR